LVQESCYILGRFLPGELNDFHRSGVIDPLASEVVLSPILVRPVREQLEHDRVIRLLQAKYKRKFDVGINPGMEQSAAIGTGTSAIYPDLVLQSTERSKKLLGVVEVETGESVNNLEAMSQWAAYGRLRAEFHLYVPASMIDVARRLCADMQISVAELWTYHPVGDQTRFTLVQRSTAAPEKAPRAARPEPAKPAAVPEAVPRPARRAAPAPAPRRKPAAVKAAPRPRTAAQKPVATRGRAAAAKKKAAPARSARTQKRK
jgi:hypothetical protein